MAYSSDLRTRVLDYYDQGLPTGEIARRLKVSRSWARRVKQRRHEPPAVHPGRKPVLDQAARALLAGWIEQTPDATLEELRGRLTREAGVTPSIGCLWNTLRRMKLTFKKSR